MEVSIVQGEFSHHTNRSKAPRSAHFMLCGTLADVVIFGMPVSYTLYAMLFVYVIFA